MASNSENAGLSSYQGGALPLSYGSTEGSDKPSAGRQALDESEAILATRGRQAQPVRMSERSKEHRKAGGRSRLAAALRDNLRRRKAQARGRQGERQGEGQEQRQEQGRGQGSAVETSGLPHDSAGIGAEK
jgi:hypothetical protein